MIEFTKMELLHELKIPIRDLRSIDSKFALNNETTILVRNKAILVNILVRT